MTRLRVFFDGCAQRYIVVGLLNTMLGLSLIFFFKLFCGDYLANLLSYVFSVPVTFYTHRRATFRDHGSVLASFGKYLLVIGVGYVANVAMLNLALRSGVDSHVAQVLATGAHVVTTYILNRFAVFIRPEAVVTSASRG